MPAWLAMDTSLGNRHMTKPGQWNWLGGCIWNPEKECSFHEVDSYQDAVEMLCAAWSPPTEKSCPIRVLLLTLFTLLWTQELGFVPSAQSPWVQTPVVYPRRLSTHFLIPDHVTGSLFRLEIYMEFTKHDNGHRTLKAKMWTGIRVIKSFLKDVMVLILYLKA